MSPAAPIAAVMILGAVTSAAADVPRLTARETVQTAVTRVVALVRDSSLSRLDAGEGVGRTGAIDRRAEIRRVAFELFDFDEVAQRALGEHWKARTPAERAQFVRLFTELLERTYTDKIESYLEGRMSFVGETVHPPYATVRSRVIMPRSNHTVDYQAHVRSGRWKVYDIVVDGVSFVSNYRSQFSRIVKTSSYAALIDLLQRNTALTGPVSASPRTTR